MFKDKIVSGRRILEFLEEHELPISIFARDKLIARFPYLADEFLTYYEKYHPMPVWSFENQTTTDT